MTEQTVPRMRDLFVLARIDYAVLLMVVAAFSIRSVR